MFWLKYEKRHNQPIRGKTTPGGEVVSFYHYGGEIMINTEIEMMAEPLEREVTEKTTITIKLTTRLRNRARKTDEDSLLLCFLLNDAADEIERLQEMIGSNDPVAMLKELWKHQPVYLFEAIVDATQNEVI
jgi:hypothetical protein